MNRHMAVLVLAGLMAAALDISALQARAGGPPATRSGTLPATMPRARVLVEPTRQFPRNGEGDLLMLKGGDLIYVFGRWPVLDDHAPGAQIGIIRSSDGGRTWSQPRTLFAETGFDLYHASLVRLKNGEIGLSYTKRSSRPSLRGEKVFRRSPDEGATWSQEVLITDGGWEFYQTSACDRLVMLSNGRLVHPASRSTSPGDPDRAIVTHVYVSDDNGRTWHRKTPQPLAEPRRRVFHEASIAEYAAGRLLMLARTRTGRLWESRSDDGGDTWSTPKSTDITAPSAPPYLTTMPDGRSLMLIWNPTASEGIYPRDILAVQFSQDGGRTWRDLRHIEHVRGAISYASGTWVGDTFHLVYLEFPGPGLRGFRPRYMTVSPEGLDRRGGEQAS